MYRMLLDLIEVLSALLRGEVQIVGGVSELAYYRAAGDGQASPPPEVIGCGAPDYVWGSRLSRPYSE